MKRSASYSVWFVAAAVLGYLIGPSTQYFTSVRQEEQPQNGTAPPLPVAPVANQTSQPMTPSLVDLRSLPYPSIYPAHDPHGRRQQQPPPPAPQQTIQLTFHPAMSPDGQVVPPGPNGAPVAASATLQAQTNQQNLIINPADIQFSVPDVPDTVSKKIIDQIRAQLGDKPVTIGELNNKFITFTTEIPGVLINRTLLTNVEEQTVVEENKSTRTTLISPTGTAYSSQTTYHQPNAAKVEVSYAPSTPIKSYSYNPAAGETAYQSSRQPAAATYQTSYSEPSYQYSVPSYGEAYDTTYKKPQEAPQYQQQSYQQAQPSYQKQNEQQTYHQPQPPYQQGPKESSYQQQSAPSYKQEEPRVIIKYIEVCSYPQQNQQNYQQPKPQPQQQSYSQGPQLQQYQQYSSVPVPSNPYVEIANGLAALDSYGTYGQDLSKSSNEAQTSAMDGYNKMAEVYAQIHDKMAQLEQLQSYVRQLQHQVSAGYGQMPPVQLPSLPMVPTYAPPTGGYQSAPAPYGTTTTSYSSPNSYSKNQQSNYQQQSSYQQQQQQSSKQYQGPQSYSAPQSYSSPQSYTTQKSQGSSSSSYNIASQLAYPQNGNEVKISYHKVEEKIQTNKTVPVVTSYGNGGNY